MIRILTGDYVFILIPNAKGLWKMEFDRIEQSVAKITTEQKMLSWVNVCQKLALVRETLVTLKVEADFFLSLQKLISFPVICHPTFGSGIILSILSRV